MPISRAYICLFQVSPARFWAISEPRPSTICGADTSAATKLCVPSTHRIVHATYPGPVTSTAFPHQRRPKYPSVSSLPYAASNCPMAVFIPDRRQARLAICVRNAVSVRQLHASCVAARYRRTSADVLHASCHVHRQYPNSILPDRMAHGKHRAACARKNARCS